MRERNVYKEKQTEHAQIQIKTVEAQMIQFKYRHSTYISNYTWTNTKVKTQGKPDKVADCQLMSAFENISVGLAPDNIH